MMTFNLPRLLHLRGANGAAAIFLFIGLNAASTASSAPVPVVAIDVGHSLSAPGATSARGVPEFRFNAALAGVLRETLRSHHVEVVPVGEDGNMRDLKLRTAIAAEKGATFFLSVHHDSVQPQYLQPWTWQRNTMQYSDQFSGFSLFVSSKNPRVDASLRCASAIGTSLLQAGFRPSTHHAEHIAGENREWADAHNGVYYYDDLVVLKTTTMPAVLLEAGIIVNRNEEEIIQRTETRKSIAEAVARGLNACGAIE